MKTKRTLTISGPTKKEIEQIKKDNPKLSWSEAWDIVIDKYRKVKAVCDFCGNIEFLEKKCMCKNCISFCE